MTIDFGEGWMAWQFSRPSGRNFHSTVEIAREEWDKPELIVVDEMPPHMNVAGLYWRPIAADMTNVVKFTK